MTLTFAIIPVREFRDSKKRLNSNLSALNRAELTRRLLQKVISSLQDSKVDRIVLVASDKLEARDGLDSFSKLEIIQESERHGGVNSAMTDGINRIPSDKESKILLLPSDLPLISASIVDRVIDLLDDCDMVINPSLRKDGTNLLGFKLSKSIQLHYDDNSVANHISEAENRKLHFKVIEWKELSVDLDDGQDLDNLMIYYNVSNFSDLVRAISR
ncbi:MAG: 2-phospho-L-lactate guanylyltransferase [Thaumarchaeota archaeon]|nr:2-phospho-L-lactate guanylyltransferase [Nitrososphaerota archaeon]